MGLAELRMIVVAIVCFCPVAIALLVIAMQRRSRLSRHKSPFKELRRRPAGEALRLKIADLDDKIGEYLGLLVVTPVLVAMSAWFLRTQLWVALLPSILLSLVFTTVISARLYSRCRERDNYRLGYEGERFVGEELTHLIAIGFEIFHDVPFKDFNVDHVLVGPTGVFAVETKTRRKPFDESKGKEYHVEFDGSCLRWPWGTDTDDLKQAANNADTLSKWLSSAVAVYVRVTPVLTLPGWWIDRKARAELVHVLNPREIVKLCRSRQQNLSPELIGQICHQLEEKCKREFE